MPLGRNLHTPIVRSTHHMTEQLRPSGSGSDAMDHQVTKRPSSESPVAPGEPYKDLTAFMDVIERIENRIESSFDSVIREMKPRQLTNNFRKPYDPWSVLSDRVQDIDKDRVSRWTSEIDTLLIYAGFFSVFVAVFIIGFGQLRTQDTGNGTHAARNITLSVAFNSLWFAALILAVVVSSLATLVKQWLLHFLDRDLDSTPRMNMLLRQHRYNIFMHQSSVPAIFSTLPALLRIAFLSFLVGLVVELSSVNHRLTFVVASLVGLWVIAYAVIFFMPLSRNGRAYKSPESLLAINAYYAVLYLVAPLSGPFLRTSLSWRGWKEIDRADVLGSKPSWREEQELDALISASTSSSLSQETFGRALRDATEDYSPARAMKLVNSIASQVSYTLSSTDTTTDWKQIWNPLYLSDGEFQGIAPHGTAALLDIAVDRVLATPTGGTHTTADAQPSSNSSNTLAALACVLVLLPYHPVCLEGTDPFSGHLAGSLQCTIQHYWSPTSQVDEATKGEIATAIFRILCLSPRLCEQRSLQPLPEDFALNVLDQATRGPKGTSGFSLASNPRDSHIRFYVALKHVVLSHILHHSDVVDISSCGEADSYSSHLAKLILSASRELYSGCQAAVKYKQEYRDKITAAIFRILCFAPELCNEESLESTIAPIPREFVLYILDNAIPDDNNHEIADFIQQLQISAPGVGFYIVLKLTELAGGDGWSLDDKLNLFVKSWEDKLNHSPSIAKVPDHIKAKMQSMEGLWSSDASAGVLGRLEELCGPFGSATAQ